MQHLKLENLGETENELIHSQEMRDNRHKYRHIESQLKDLLHRSEQRFNITFHANPSIMSIVRMEDLSYIDVNKAWENAMGFKQKEVIGRRVSELNIIVNQDEWKNFLNTLRQSNHVNSVKTQARSKEGKVLDLVLSAELTEMQGELCFLSTCIDVTEIRRLEKEMARLERLNLIGEMAAGIGHEIRNPLTAIRGFLQMLNDNECYANDRSYFALMIEELDRANTIISEYLGMTREKELNLERICLDEVILSLYPMLKADANYREMNLDLELDSPPAILIDQNEIRQMILNMARNGIDSMSPGGTLTIGTTDCRQYVVLYIKDQGHGLDDSLIKKLGTPFCTTKDKGTGLGLYVCYSIAERYSAQIEVESSSRGTTFKILFPTLVGPASSL